MTQTHAEDVTEERFREVVRHLLFPLFPGTEFVDRRDYPPPEGKLVAQVGPQTDFRLRPHERSAVCVLVRRRQSFSPHERRLIAVLFSSLERAYRDWDTPYRKDTLASVMAEVIAKSVAPRFANTVSEIMRTLIEWSQQTYEGQKVAFSVGIDPKDELKGDPFLELAKRDFLKVLSSGHDSIVLTNSEGGLTGHRVLGKPKRRSNRLMAPLRYEGLAAWTNRVSKGRVGLALNRNGEILVFRDGQLRFARRRGDWRYFAHDSIVKVFSNAAMARNSDEAYRREIYRTALDVAFARSGACIGVLNAQSRNRALLDLVEFEDRLCGAESGEKARAVRAIVHGRPFAKLSRQLRLELASIDGATVLGHNGVVLAVGAILRIPGSDGHGGRTAAARALAKYGLGIKVSNDGYIWAWNRENERILELG